MDIDTNTRVILDDEKKSLIREHFGIDLDSDLFDPRYDYVAKRILAAESLESKQALVHLLNASLELVGGETVVDLTVINPEIPVDSTNYKKSKFDIRARFQNGEQGIIEVEWRKKADNFKKRSQFIISKAYSSQDISGLTYNHLKRCYLICIVDHTLFDKDNEYFRDGMFRDAKGNPITDDQIILFFELSKIEGLLTRPVEELSDIECWLLFFKYIADKSKRDKLNKILERKEGVSMAAQILETISKDERERAALESQMLYELDYRSDMACALAEGKAEGESKTIEMIKSLLGGVSVKELAEKYNKPVEDVEKIHRELLAV